MTGPGPAPVKCPRCFTALPHDKVAWTEATPESVAHNPTASAYAGVATSTGQVHTANRPENSPDWIPASFDVHRHVEVCVTCHYTLPPMWRYGEATCVAMAGARYTGKTVFIAVLIKQLQQYTERFHREVIPADDETANRYSAIYETPLFVERGIVQATPSAASEAHHPLIFDLGVWDGLKRFLVIRDVAGEDLEEAKVAGPAWEFFSRADAVFFLFDPLRVEDVSDQLRDLIPDSSRVGGDPRDVLRVVMRLISGGNPRLGVILSKFDALQELSRVKNSAWGQVMGHPGAAFNRDPSLVNRSYDETDGQLLDAEVRSLLQRLRAGPSLLNMVDPVTGQQYHHRFFAVSALGESPEGERLHPNGISPFRCMDPIRWVLADRHVLQE
ncbi:hypothetical protein GYA93_14405 [Gordonia desulfuricans]|uniref:Double-GTPase 2 domain-containing protein n=1 Tax=Gordonia desulfuricans TaxID=89051 RepID=A0A7K3LR72_9ACTN|nr:MULTISPECIES: hypothetical protein [Gordonia]KOY49590.1 hypothetical protein ISGA_09065 [Gordonia sp. NB41Y]NDK90764.1 hypothetical protein [Gordonia desulfuricans]WLP88616.1 hypothetical protein Q9K23_13370 [Gordonia sp. NB41Y]